MIFGSVFNHRARCFLQNMPNLGILNNICEVKYSELA